MITYYERYLSCGCGIFERQTAKNIPLDWIGRKLAHQHLTDFRLDHNCKSRFRYSSWRLIVPDKDYFSNKK